MSHEVEQSLGAYALGALDAGERHVVESHLQDCASCRELLADYQGVAEGLLQLAPARRPPATLRERVAAATGRLPAGEQSGGPGRAKFRLGLPQLTLAGLALALVANLYLLAQVRTLSARTEALLAQQRANQTALAVMGYPNSQVANLEQDSVRGSFIYDDHLPMAVLNVWGLPPLSAQQAYQLWLIQEDGSRASGGLMQPNREDEFVSLVVWSPVSFESIEGIGITVEPAEGSPGPTGPRVLGANLAHGP